METQLPQKESCLQLTLRLLERARQEGSGEQESNRSWTGVSQTLMESYPLLLRSDSAVREMIHNMFLLRLTVTSYKLSLLVRVVFPNFPNSQIIFDECHKAKNATSTKMGKAVLDLQNKLPRARVVYASATGRLKCKPCENKGAECIMYEKYLCYLIITTGASEPKNMIYMSRLGIWGEGTPFRAFDDFLHTIEKRLVQ